jgi:hypothetical protein
MYLFETSLGEAFKPRQKTTPTPPPKAPVQRAPNEGKVVRDGHWRWCPAPSAGSLGCDLNLTVRFRRSFHEFLREVENAYGKWMARPTVQMLVKKLQKDLKKWHDDMLYYKLRDNTTLVLVAGLDYGRSNGKWLVHDSSLRLWRKFDLRDI